MSFSHLYSFRTYWRWNVWQSSTDEERSNRKAKFWIFGFCWLIWSVSPMKCIPFLMKSAISCIFHYQGRLWTSSLPFHSASSISIWTQTIFFPYIHSPYIHSTYIHSTYIHSTYMNSISIHSCLSSTLIRCSRLNLQ